MESAGLPPGWRKWHARFRLYGATRRNRQLQSLRGLEIGHCSSATGEFALFLPGPDFGSCLMLAEVNKNSRASTEQRIADSLGLHELQDRTPLRYC